MERSFLSGISILQPQFLIYLWDRFIPQENITLNLLRKSRIHPTLSSYEELEGKFNYNKTPLFPPGCKVLVHEKTVTRNTWGLRSSIGWYIGTELNHYRCVKVYLPDSKSERITDNITIINEDSISTDLSPHESILQYTKDLTQELQKYLKGKEVGPYKSTI